LGIILVPKRTFGELHQLLKVLSLLRPSYFPGSGIFF
jgi:hypothetical protein